MPGARLGASVYTFTVGDALERKQITDPDELRNMVATGKLDTTLAPMDGSVKPGGLPRAMHRKYYKSMSGFCDTPKEVVEGIKRSLCEFDDVVSRCAPQTVVSFFLYYAAKLFCFFLLWVTWCQFSAVVRLFFSRNIVFHNLSSCPCIGAVHCVLLCCCAFVEHGTILSPQTPTRC